MKIQISDIRPHPSNPRSFLRQDFVDVTSKSMDKDGLKNPVRLVLLTGERQAADGLIAQGVKYYILSGHYRYEAAKKLGWKEIEADVKDNLTPEQEMMELILG